VSTIDAIEHRDAGAALRRLATPNALALVGDQLLGIVDTIAIGVLGTAALAGITGAVGVFMVLGIGLFAFGSGVRIAGAQAIGARQSERFGAIVRAAIVVPLASRSPRRWSRCPARGRSCRRSCRTARRSTAASRYLILRCFC